GKKKDEVNVVLDRTPFYAEMGGQVGDRGLLHVQGHDWTEVGQLRVTDTQKRGDVFVHRAQVVEGRAPKPGEAARVSGESSGRKFHRPRRNSEKTSLNCSARNTATRFACCKSAERVVRLTVIRWSSAAART